MTRREALMALTAAAPLRAAVAPPKYQPVLGTQIYVWTQQKAEIEAALAGVRKAGYDRIELMAQQFTPEMAPRTLAALRTHSLELCSTYIGGPMHESAAAEATIQAALALADEVKPVPCAMINFNASPLKEPKTDGQLACQAKAMNELGEQLKMRGQRLTIHQHAPEMANGAHEWRYVLRNTDPKLVSFCVDVDWIKRGGQDVAEILSEAGPRIASLHLRSAKNGVWMEELGDGDVNYRHVARYLKLIGYRGLLLVELAYEKGTNPTRPLDEDLRRSRLYAEEVFFK